MSAAAGKITIESFGIAPGPLDAYRGAGPRRPSLCPCGQADCKELYEREMAEWVAWGKRGTITGLPVTGSKITPAATTPDTTTGTTPAGGVLPTGNR